MNIDNPNKTKKKILITGGLGFIGSGIARKNVEIGNEVTILTRSLSKINNIADIHNRVNLSVRDIREIQKEDVEDKDYIFHLAGTVDNYAIKEGQPYKDININCAGTIALLEAMREYNPQAKLMFASTFFVNGNVDKLPVNAESPCHPLGLYPTTRLAAENFCQVYNNVFDIPFLIARFTNVFGPPERGDNNKKAGFNFMINQAVKGEELKVYNNGDFYRDYIYVDDVVDGCQTLAEKGEIGHIYYVGRGEFVKFKKLIDIIGQQIPGLKTTPIVPPKFHKNVGITDFVCDNTPLKNLGWSPKVSLEEGIKRTIEFYRANPQ
ncbi:MAG: NAD-dependent epimerase/dehydratase family protein [Candidatus Pacearchaeota archaeon]